MSGNAIPQYLLDGHRQKRAWIEKIVAGIEEVVGRDPTGLADLPQRAALARRAWHSAALGLKGLLRTADELEAIEPGRSIELVRYAVTLVSGLVDGMNLSSAEVVSGVVGNVHVLHAASMRDRRSRKHEPFDEALRAAVSDATEGKSNAELNERGFAGRILSKVNAALAKGGHPAVLIDVVRRRIRNVRS